MERLIGDAITNFNLLFGVKHGVYVGAPTCKNSNSVIASQLSANKNVIAEDDCDKSDESCIQSISECLSAFRDYYFAEMKRNTILQELLINELNHTEQLEAEVRSLKEELNIVIKQRENYKKKSESQLAELEMLNSNLQNSDSNTLPGADFLLDGRLLGKFVAKKFSG